MAQKFLRRIAERYSKLGKRRKKKQKWRRPKGRDNKMREKRRGYPAVVSVGHRSKKSDRGMVKGKLPVIIRTPDDLQKIGKDKIGLIANVGKKKRIEIAKKANSLGILLTNLNIPKFLKQVEKEKKKKEKTAKPAKKENKKEDKKKQEVKNESD